MAKSKKQLRAEAVKRLRNGDPETTADFIRILFDGLKVISPGKVRAALIDLLTDEPMDAESDANGTCPNGNGTCPNGADTREKLEADAKAMLQKVYERGVEDGRNGIEGTAWSTSSTLALLDRQAHITERETVAMCKGAAEHLDRVNDGLRERIAELEADARACERCEADMAHDMDALMRENAKLSSDELMHRAAIGLQREMIAYYQEVHRQMRALLDGATLVDEKGEVVA